MSRLTRFVRLMHTSGRQIANPGQGGAPGMGSTSPLPHSSLPSVQPESQTPILDFEPAIHDPSELQHPASSTSRLGRKYTLKGKPIISRPARTVPVALPSGYPEPRSYPPSEDYIAGMENQKRAPHPLWQFFHVPESSLGKLSADVKSPRDGGSLETYTADEGNVRSGRSWAASELRQKSFGDLHTLWYVLLKELNVLATQREERRRLGIMAREAGELITKRAFRCRKSMARIKYVLNERRLGLLAAASPYQSTAPNVPFSASTSSDPFAGIDALRNTAEIPTWIQTGPTIAESEAEIAEGETGELEAEAGEHETVVSDAEVGKEEVESRDEGFGGGEEAKEFVRDVQVGEGGHVEIKK
ncbi:mitochondrial 39-S ribosomal protein L47 (MRP-L47)-domain-containing protein [Dioszegia hungarica]|uniref:Large ribosomal subunit protein uL29m n=1 Tax=Dioszegia hungarica TaxID=4972 RepID=A0AA38H4Z8_9TREE|nr:mitochondrial 39-S ribosomal protein L47 (MRP-L47)-domain-containing protein [Dioszegia hungarica]KAI9634090.1 mitochondrial 39-S ribosomal protein L47 (MRP-L47)-domain-containing protein [Dioszegia hungarica]